MNNYYSPGGFSMMPKAVKNLLIINVLFFIATLLLKNKDIDLYELCGLPWVESSNFHVWQFVTYMFMHGNFSHLLFNMFALWMFGYLLENIWGTKRFLIYYFVTGIGAALVQLAINWYGFNNLHQILNIYAANPNINDFEIVLKNNFEGLYRTDVIGVFVSSWRNNPSNIQFSAESLNILTELINGKMSIPMVGASGAVFGILLAFGVMFPNQKIYVYFLFPIKAKFFVIIYGALELFFGVSGTQSGVAHFAHLGGMLFGFLLIMYWKKKYKYRS